MTNSIDLGEKTDPRVNVRPSIRVQTNILARRERVLLSWFCAQMPHTVTPDKLTAIGVGGAAIVLIGYVGSQFQPAFFWLANVGLLINWFGDSLDGSLARFRGIERPRYGYFLDHSADAVSNFLILVGLGFSAYMRLDVALFVLTGYFLLSIYIFLYNHVYGVLQISFASLGPTELRVGLGLMNIWMCGAGVSNIAILGQSFSAYDLVFASVAAILIFVSILNILQAGRRLRREDVQAIGAKARLASPPPEPFFSLVKSK